MKAFGKIDGIFFGHKLQIKFFEWLADFVIVFKNTALLAAIEKLFLKGE